jgi:hypothetical protein
MNRIRHDGNAVRPPTTKQLKNRKNRIQPKCHPHVANSNLPFWVVFDVHWWGVHERK